MKTPRQPGIFLLVKVVLLLNIATSAFLLLILLGGTLYDSVSSSFAKTEVVLDVRTRSHESTTGRSDETSAYGFEQSNTGDLKVMMPWYTPIFVPFGFFNIPGFKLSVPYLVFYSVLCFLFYRIIDSIALESPFSDKNIKRIFLIGYILIAYDSMVVIRYVFLSWYVENITDNSFRYDGLGPLVYFKVGILVIILAMIYRRGVLMQREQELTI